jgi:hypothetical protein
MTCAKDSDEDTLRPPCPPFNPCDGLAAVAVHIGGIDRQMEVFNANLAMLVSQVKTIGLALGIKFAVETPPPIEGLDAE